MGKLCGNPESLGFEEQGGAERWVMSQGSSQWERIYTPEHP